MWKMTPISVRLNLKNFILISCAVLELLRKVSQGGGGEIGLSLWVSPSCFNAGLLSQSRLAPLTYLGNQLKGFPDSYPRYL